jgi:purine-nucleoside phosphorylase
MTSRAFVLADEAADHIKNFLPPHLSRPRIGIICGSGLSGLVSSFDTDSQISIPYANIPNFPVSTVSGHQSRLVFGTMGEKKVRIAAMVGRLHFYEGHDMTQITLPIRVLHLLGIEILIGMHRNLIKLTCSHQCGWWSE